MCKLMNLETMEINKINKQHLQNEIKHCYYIQAASIKFNLQNLKNNNKEIQQK